MNRKVEYLVHVISEKRIRANLKKIDSIEEWEPPCNSTEMLSFIGLCN